MVETAPECPLDLKQDVRIPPAFFSPSHIGKDAFLKDEPFLKEETEFLRSFIIFIISKFSNFDHFLIFSQKTQSKWKDILKKYQLRRTLQKICHV